LGWQAVRRPSETGKLGKAFRLLYNYFTGLFYISISHYNIWQEKQVPVKNEGRAKQAPIEKNPFLEVISIP
jgi:hypothetical protein